MSSEGTGITVLILGENNREVRHLINEYHHFSRQSHPDTFGKARGDLESDNKIIRTGELEYIQV